MSWHIHTAGPTNGRPTLLLHGWLGQGSEWLPLLPAGPPYRYWIMPDLPGHCGQTHNPQEAAGWSLATSTAALVETLRRKHKLKHWDTIGYSMGGRFALYMAVHYPKQVSALMLENCQPGIIDDEERNQRAALDDQRAETIRQEGLDAFVQRWYQTPLFATLQQKPRLLAALTAARLVHQPEGVAAALAAFSPGRQPPLWDALPSLTMPVTLLTGAKDPSYRKIMRQIAREIPHARWYMAENTGHNVHAEAPKLWLRCLQGLATQQTHLEQEPW